jgi:hypothetical protein
VNRLAPLLALLVATLVGVAWAQIRPPVPGTDARAPSRVIYPEQTIPLRFSHARHVALPGVNCLRCHAAARTSDRVEDRLIPPESACAPCHAIDRAQPVAPGDAGAGRCDLCHTDWRAADPQRAARVDVPPARLRFSHARHLARDGRCETCHANVNRVGLATRLELPRMEQCLQCHRPGGAPDACATCHLTEPDGVLRGVFPEGRLNPPRWMQGLHHDADFWFTHRATAAADATRCAVCHRDDECAACHDGRVRDRRAHPNDYLSQHRVDARINANQCGTCHRAATFCVACHTRLGMTSMAPLGARPTERVHPPASVWVEGPVTARHHGAEARRALPSCVSCHAERDCAVCHATRALGGGGVSPHPPGFSARCGALLQANARPCAVCHEDLAALRGQCR